MVELREQVVNNVENDKRAKSEYCKEIQYSTQPVIVEIGEFSPQSPVTFTKFTAP